MNRSRAAAGLGVVVLTAMLGGCAVSSGPTYEEVRAEALEAVDAVTALFPDTLEYVPRPEQDPWRCGGAAAPVMDGPEGTAFHTARGEATVPEGFDADEFVRGLPDALGDDWTLEPNPLDLSYASLTMTHRTDGVTLGVDVSTIAGETLIDITAISQCGQLPEHEQR